MSTAMAATLATAARTTPARDNGGRGDDNGGGDDEGQQQACTSADLTAGAFVLGAELRDLLRWRGLGEG